MIWSGHKAKDEQTRNVHLKPETILIVITGEKDEMSESTETGEKREEAKREIRDALRSLRQEVQRMAKDVQVVADSTQKFVETMAPVVSSTIDENMARASESFKRMMSAANKQTRPQQVQLLKNYRTFLQGQLNRVEKRLEELAK